VEEAYAAGVLLVAAAGNDGDCSGNSDSVDYPARYAEVIAVAATMSSDGTPCFSSTGPAVELAAPGVSIYSTYKDGAYATSSGTSMAAPHVAGAAALVLASGNLADEDGDGDMDNVDTRLRMQKTAEGLGLPATWVGHGLVDALAAAGQSTPTPPPVSENQTPVADPGGPYTGATGVEIAFDGSGSSDPDEDALTYSWDFGDGATGTGVSPSHAYAAAGTYTVTLVVNDGAVDSAPATTTATVEDPPAPDAIDVTIASFDAGIAVFGRYSFSAQVRNESAASPATIAADLEVLDSSGAVVVRLESKTATISPGGTVDLRWSGRASIPRGTYTARLTIADEDPPEVATDTFRAW
jgi:subtilisin family serine protease